MQQVLGPKLRVSDLIKYCVASELALVVRLDVNVTLGVTVLSANGRVFQHYPSGFYTVSRITEDAR